MKAARPRPSKRTRTPAAACGWSDLPSEIGGAILGRVPSMSDRARFRSVCRQWRLAAQQYWRLLPPALPWLTTSLKCVFVGFPDGARHSLPVHVHASSWDAFDRWLLCRVVRADDDDGGAGSEHLLLRNPLLSEETSMVLPSIGGEYGIRKLVVCSSDLVAAITYVDRLRTIAFCRPGEGRWSPVQRPEGVGRVLDIAVHRGELYALYDRDTLCAYGLGEAVDGHGVSGRVRRCISGVRPQEAEARFLAFEAKHYLLPSPSRGTLLLVRSIGATFDVFELEATDDDGGRWSQVTSLADDEALFLGARSSRALAASHSGGAVRGNRIYFAGETHRGRDYLDEARGSMGVYDMSSGAISWIGLPRGSFDDDCQPTGSWLFLSTAS